MDIYAPWVCPVPGRPGEIVRFPSTGICKLPDGAGYQTWMSVREACALRQSYLSCPKTGTFKWFPMGCVSVYTQGNCQTFVFGTKRSRKQLKLEDFLLTNSEVSVHGLASAHCFLDLLFHGGRDREHPSPSTSSLPLPCWSIWVPEQAQVQPSVRDML